MYAENISFDTRLDTIKYFVPMTISIKLRNYINKEGLSPLFLNVTSNGKRERIPLDIHVKRNYWIKDKQILKGPAEHTEIENLLINNVKAKVNKIKVFYKLSFKDLTLTAFVSEFKNNLPRANFVSFFNWMLEDRRATIAKSTYAKEKAVWNKLRDYQAEVLFHEIDQMWILKYRNHLARLGNIKTTRNGNIKIIKKYLGFAEKAGVQLQFNLNDIKPGTTKGNKNYLNALEIQKVYKYYLSEFISENEKIALGYFLFGCFTGLRFSDIMAQSRSELLRGYFTFTHVKTKKTQSTRLNKKAFMIIKECDKLFVKRYSDMHTRRLIKEVCKSLKINKNIDFHMSRHSFGTNYILLGGNVAKLQILMNHSDIKETMAYVHLAELEKNAEADLLDNLF